MQVDFPAQTGRVTLQGEWSISEAVERQETLAGELELLLGAEPRVSRVAIDLNGVTGIDPCGCQLLAVFLENLTGHGIVPDICGLPPEVWETISLLGFADSFATPCAPAKDEV